MNKIRQVALPVPLRQTFDYLCPVDVVAELAAPVGSRVRVPFGRQSKVGLVVGQAPSTDLSADAIKNIEACLDDAPIVTAEQLRTACFAAQYYQHGLGETLASLLPKQVFDDVPCPKTCPQVLRLTQDGAESWRLLRQGSKLRQLAQRLADDGSSVNTAEALKHDGLWASVNTLLKRDVVQWADADQQTRGEVVYRGPTLNDEQQAAASAINTDGGFQDVLLDGVTGSGKTEVYLHLAAKVLNQGKQVLMLVPEIGLTPQLLARVRDRLGIEVACYHSRMSDMARWRVYLGMLRGEIDMVVGTRSASCLPLPRPGLMVVDEEHDASYKQFDGLHYHARDVLLYRAKQFDVPIVLGSATPSLSTLFGVEKGTRTHLKLTQRAGGAQPARVHLIDMRHVYHAHQLSDQAMQALTDCMARGEQALVFRNQRGYAPVLHCQDCGWHAGCTHCDAAMTVHHGGRSLQCHHCGATARQPNACPACGSMALKPTGVGTEQLAETLRTMFAEHQVLQIDRDTTKGKDGLEKALARVGEHSAILVGTQMLAKGHDLNKLSLVVVVDVDGGLFALDFRAQERTAQLLVQVAGRAGRRADRPGTVLLQTRQPEHPLFHTLLAGGYPAFVAEALPLRDATELPPYGFMALVRVSAKNKERLTQWLAQAVDLLPHHDALKCVGPAPAPMAYRAGRHRAQLLLSSPQRKVLHQALQAWVTRLPISNQTVRWSIDVDPLDLY